MGVHALLQKNYQRNINPQTKVEHPTLASGLLIAWRLEKELRTAMWSLKQALTINCFQKWFGGQIRLGMQTGSGNVVTKANVENLMSPNCLGGHVQVGSKPKVVKWSPEQVLNT